MAWVTLRSLFEKCHFKLLEKYKHEYCKMKIHDNASDKLKKLFEQKYKNKKSKFFDLFDVPLFKQPEWTSKSNGNIVHWCLVWVGYKYEVIHIITLTPTNKKIRKQIGKIHDKFYEYLRKQNEM